MPEKRRILFIDDEPFFAAGYVRQLQEQFEVQFLERADAVLPYLEENPGTHAVVLDIMMPSPDQVPEEETSGGMDTGLWLLDKMRYLGAWPFPVMILTNRNPQGIREELAARKFGEKSIRVRHKLDTPAFTLPNLLEDLISGKPARVI